ncbi:MAG: DUF1513 domain-containing protein [Rhizobiaceae bacterium]|nr:DUF1513 domain-containing protein [Rhizobiaceae bacterium]
MTATAIERRGFLRAAGAGFAATLLPRQAEALAHTDAIFAAAYRSEGGSYGVALVAEDGREISRIALPDRGHDITHDPNSSHAVAFARRPGTFALVFDRSAGTPVTLIEAAEDRHFFGHGVYAPSGRLLYIAENDFDNYAGVIGLYDARSGYAKVGEFPAHGMDTHDVQLMEGGRYLAIANGGIRQHPDSGRAKLNLDHMEPSLVIVDLRDGRLVEKHAMPDEIRQLSTRHMDIDASGRVWFGCQFEGPRNRHPQLLGNFRRGEEVRFLDMPGPLLEGFDNYVGSVAVNREAGLVAISSPKGGRWAAFEVETGRLAYGEEIAGVCGLAPQRERFIRSTENGDFAATTSPLAWDNHIIRLG